MISFFSSPNILIIPNLLFTTGLPNLLFIFHLIIIILVDALGLQYAFKTNLRLENLGGSVKHPPLDFGSDHDLVVREFEPCICPQAYSMETA